MEYCVAAAFADGAVTLASFADEAVARPAVRGVMNRVQVTEDGPPSNAPLGGSAVVTVTLRDREPIASARAVVPRGDPQNPLSWAQLAQKFRDCAEPVLAGDRIERAVGVIETLDGLSSVGELTDVLASER